MFGSGALTCSGFLGARSPVDTRGKLTTQFMRLVIDDTAFAILVRASADLYNLPTGLSRAVILFGADLDERPYQVEGALVITPVFLEPGDPRIQPDMPVWQVGDWARGERSGFALKGVCALAVVDGLLRYLTHHPAFADLQGVELVGHGLGAELLRRHAARGAGNPGRFRLRYRLQRPAVQAVTPR
ncbi:MAG TPA: hypothetical protein DEO91_07555 [Pseudomonas sp.]|nr:hypothetical protein [Pseudomonas sp.]